MLPVDYKRVYRHERLFHPIDIFYSTLRGWAVSTRKEQRFFEELADCISYLVAAKVIKEQDAAQIQADAMRGADLLDALEWGAPGRFAYIPERKLETR